MKKFTKNFAVEITYNLTTLLKSKVDIEATLNKSMGQYPEYKTSGSGLRILHYTFATLGSRNKCLKKLEKTIKDLKKIKINLKVITTEWTGETWTDESPVTYKNENRPKRR